jgi:predicted nucleic acid-binding protein
VRKGEIQLRISDIVVFEVVFTLERRYRHEKARIQQAVLPLIELPGIMLSGKARYPTVFEIYVGRNISFADAYHAVVMQESDVEEVVSFDRDFDRVDGIRRIEP